MVRMRSGCRPFNTRKILGMHSVTVYHHFLHNHHKVTWSTHTRGNLHATLHVKSLVVTAPLPAQGGGEWCGVDLLERVVVPWIGVVYLSDGCHAGRGNQPSTWWVVTPSHTALIIYSVSYSAMTHLSRTFISAAVKGPPLSSFPSSLPLSLPVRLPHIQSQFSKTPAGKKSHVMTFMNVTSINVILSNKGDEQRFIVLINVHCNNE